MLNLKKEFIAFLKSKNLYVRFRQEFVYRSCWKYPSINSFFDIVDAKYYMLNNHIVYMTQEQGETYLQVRERQNDWAIYEVEWLLWLIKHNYEISACWNALSSNSLHCCISAYSNTYQTNDALYNSIKAIYQKTKHLIESDVIIRNIEYNLQSMRKLIDRNQAREMAILQSR